VLSLDSLGSFDRMCLEYRGTTSDYPLRPFT